MRRAIGYVPQALSADADLTGYENLLIFAKLYDIPAKQRQQRIRDVLEFMGLQAVAHRIVRQYSGGTIRRLEVAQSILHKPQVLFLDEPTVGLDLIALRIWLGLHDFAICRHSANCHLCVAVSTTGNVTAIAIAK